MLAKRFARLTNVRPWIVIKFHRFHDHNNTGRRSFKFQHSVILACYYLHFESRAWIIIALHCDNTFRGVFKFSSIDRYLKKRMKNKWRKIPSNVICEFFLSFLNNKWQKNISNDELNLFVFFLGIGIVNFDRVEIKKKTSNGTY